jgi:hypothetical protein
VRRAFAAALKKKVVIYQVLGTYLIVLIVFLKAFFGRFVTRGVQKHGGKKSKKSISAHHKKCGFFSLRFFFFLPRLFCSFFLIAFLGVS